MRRIVGRLPSWVRGRTGRILGAALLVLPAVGYIAYRSYRNWDQLRAAAWSFRPAYWALTLVGYALAAVCVLWAWNRIAGQLTPVKRFGQNARLYCLSNLPRHIPGSIWYMAGRSYLYKEVGVPASLTMAGIALEVFLTTVAGLLTYLLSLPLAGALGAAPLRLGIALGLLALALLFLQPPVFNRVLGFFLRRFGSQEQVRITYRGLLPPLLAYVLAWGIGGVTLYTVVLSVYEQVPWQEIAVVIGIWAAAGTVGLLASTFLVGFGVREATLSVLLTVLIPEDRALVVAILFWFLLTGGDLALAGLFALLSRGRGSGRGKAAEPGAGPDT
jgi:uncharacterized membrane protein YbhN (UPF0104 family)